MFEKILVPIDGSKCASDALTEALKLAKIHGSEVEILHVMTYSEEIPKMVPDEQSLEASSPPAWVSEYMDKIEENDEEMLKSVLEHVKISNPGMKIVTKLLKGRAGEAILWEAEQGGFDLIVIGNRGLSGLKEFVLGSVSHQVVDHSKVPVLVVK